MSERDTGGGGGVREGWGERERGGGLGRREEEQTYLYDTNNNKTYM